MNGHRGPFASYAGRGDGFPAFCARLVTSPLWGCCIGLSVIVFDVMKITYENTITFGDIVVICVGLLALTPVLYAVFSWLRERRHPITMRFIGEGKPSKKRYLQKGTHRIMLRLTTRVPMEISHINICFIDRRFLGIRNAPVNRIAIQQIHRMDFGDIQDVPFQHYLNVFDGTARAVSQSPRKWMVEHNLYIDMTVKALARWAGFVKVEIIHDYKSPARCFVKITDISRLEVRTHPGERVT
jgi:hypothetical protein